MLAMLSRDKVARQNRTCEIYNRKFFLEDESRLERTQKNGSDSSGMKLRRRRQTIDVKTFLMFFIKV